MAPLYKPPIKGQTRQYPFLALVSQADPSFQRARHRDIEYEMGSGKAYYGNPLTRGPYSRLSSVYAVGQPQGAPDPLITAALTTTAGVSTPGLFAGTDDGKGWA